MLRLDNKYDGPMIHSKKIRAEKRTVGIINIQTVCEKRGGAREKSHGVVVGGDNSNKSSDRIIY